MIEPPPVDLRLRAEIERRFNQPAVEQASQPVAQAHLLSESEGVMATP
ncbi:MAG: hypothetical protein JRN54_10200 [Nitrososphaerota archaeon]|nr:hypothetical protein [Nitrososphaerota archaeon]